MGCGPRSSFRQVRTFVQTNSAGALWRTTPDALLNPGILTGLLERYRERFRFSDLDLQFVVRSAIVRQSPSARFWSERLGIDRAADLIKEISRGEDEAARLGAVTTAAVFPEAAGDLVPFCLELALQHPAESVRRAAGLSLARLARDSDLQTLREKLAERAMKARVKETLADLARGGRELSSFGWRLRKQAQRKARSQRLLECEKEIRYRSRVGAIQGFRGGLVWTATVGLMLFGLLAALEEDQLTIRAWVVASGLALTTSAAVSLVLGPLLGWLCAWSAARDAAVHSEGSWFAAAFRGPGRVGALVVLGAVVSLNIPVVSCIFFAFLGLPVLVMGLLLVFGGGASRVFRSCYWPGIGSRSAWAWALVVSAGLPILIPAAVWALSSLSPVVGSVVGEEWGLPLFGVAITWSFATCVSALALARSSEARPLGALPACTPSQRLRSRAIAMAIVLLLGGGFVGLLGIDTIPLLAPAEVFDPGRGFSHQASLGPLRPDVHYFWIKNKAGEAQVARITKLNGQSVSGSEESSAERRGLQLGTHSTPQIGDVLVLPQGRHLANFALRGPESAGSSEPAVTIEPVQVPLAPEGSEVRLSLDKEALYRFRVVPMPGQEGTWNVGLAASLESVPSSGAQAVLVDLLWLNPNPTPGFPRTLEVEPSGRSAYLEPVTKELLSKMGALEFSQGTSWAVTPDESGRFSLELVLTEKLDEASKEVRRKARADGPPEVLVRLSLQPEESSQADE